MNKTFRIEDCIAGYCGDIVLDTNRALKEQEGKIISIIKDNVKLNILKTIKFMHMNAKVTMDKMINELSVTDKFAVMDDNNLSEYIFNEYIKIKTMYVIDHHDVSSSYTRKISITIPMTSEHVSDVDIVDKVIKMALALKQESKEYEDTIMSFLQTKYKTTDLLKDYIILHERIKVLYKMLEIYRYITWYDSIHNKKKNYWKDYYVIVKKTINIETRDLICKENMENVSVRNNKIREIKNEIKRYHRLQSNIQTVLNTVCEIGDVKAIHREYNTEEEVPSQFKNDMNYTYYVLLNR